MRSWTDYILGTYCSLFGNFSVRDPQNNSDHYVVLGCIHSASLREHARYLGGRKRLPLCPPNIPMREDRIFAALRRAVPKPRDQEAGKNTWILATTWRLLNERVSARQYIAKEQALIRSLGRAIKASLREDRKRRAYEAGAGVEKLSGSDPPLHREACQRIKEWYKAAVDRAPPPARVTLKWIMAERLELYSHVPPPETNIPIFVQPFLVDNSVPTEDEIEWAVTQLRNHLSRGASGMREEHLKRWLATVQKSEKEAMTTKAMAGTKENRGTMAVQPATEPTEADNWEMVVDLVQTAFGEGKLAEEATW